MSKPPKGMSKRVYGFNYGGYMSGAQEQADEIVAEKGAYASSGSAKKCPGCGGRHVTGALGRPTCVDCWPRVPLELRTVWRDRLTARVFHGDKGDRLTTQEAQRVIRQWFLDNSSPGGDDGGV